MTRTFKTEFPDFDPSWLPTIPDGWEDTSWKCDSCPCFMRELSFGGGLRLFTDYPTLEQRAERAEFRYSLQLDVGHAVVTVVDTDDWLVVKTWISHFRFLLK